jgi:hypothetical protein
VRQQVKKKSEELAEQIQDKKELLKYLNDEMEKLKPAAWEELSLLTRSWIEAEMAGTIQSKPALFTSLGSERLRALKSKVAALETDFRVWHETRRPIRQGTTDIFLNAYQSMTGSLGAILAEYNLLDVHDENNQWVREGDNWKLKYGPELRGLAMPVITKYRSIEREEDEAKRLLTSLEKDLASAKAKEMWDSV